MKNMQEMLKKAQEMQQKFSQIQQEMEEKTVEGTSGGGMVTAVVNGKGRLLSLVIDPEIVDKNDIEMLQDMIIAGVNKALENSQEMVNEEVKKVSGNIDITKLFK
ncbi:MAG: YbaB/EbfC family nucleoid-associated protein [bacterium]